MYNRDVQVLLGFLIVVAGTWGFIVLLDEVKEGDTQTFDVWAIRAMARWHGPQYPLIEDVARDITALGSVTVLAIVTLAVVGYLLIIRKYGATWLVLIATIGCLILSSVLKWLVDRPRPDVVEHLAYVHTASFPSGHSMMSAVVYLTLGSLLARIAPRRRVKLYFLVVALALTFLVGVSRVYMAVHWPSDVLAGWTAGLVWAILCWLVARQLQRRGTVERDVDDADPEDKGREKWTGQA